jgi:hypothetical protein
MTAQIKTIKAEDGDYTALQAWEDDADDLSTLADPWWAECYSGFNLDKFTKSAWANEPTQESERVRIYAAPGHEHDGSWSTSSGAYISITSGWNITSYGQQLDFFTFEGLLLINSKNNGGTVLVSGGGGGNGLELRRLWLYKTHATPTVANVYIQTNSSSDASDVLLQNCVIWRATDGLYISTLSGSPAFVGTIRNCTVYGCSDKGIQTGFTTSVNNTLTLQNIVCSENAGGDFYVAGVDTLVIQNNMSSDATADDDGGTGHLINVAAADVFKDAGNGDFTLSFGSVAQNAGKKLAAVPTDIFGHLRP